MNKRILLVIGTLVLASLACSYASRLLESGESLPLESQQPQSEPAPEAQQIPSNVLFQDDFADTSSGWDRFSDADGMTDYENGAYRIFIDKPEFTFWANPGLGDMLPSDVRIEVDAAKVGGPDLNDFGVICRYSITDELANFYEFIISSDGYAGIVLVSESTQEVISGDGQLQPFDGILQGEATNHIQAVCFGNLLTLYINGVEFASVTDTTLANGDVGLLASTYDEAGVDILFDNFIVTEP